LYWRPKKKVKLSKLMIVCLYAQKFINMNQSYKQRMLAIKTCLKLRTQERDNCLTNYQITKLRNFALFTEIEKMHKQSMFELPSEMNAQKFKTHSIICDHTYNKMLILLKKWEIYVEQEKNEKEKLMQSQLSLKQLEKLIEHLSFQENKKQLALEQKEQDAQSQLKKLENF